MKKIIFLSFVLLMLSSCGTNNGKQSINIQDKQILKTEKQQNIINEDKSEEYIIDQSDFVDASWLLKDIADTWSLSDEEKEGLVLMREEEKLARDVYITLYDKWWQNIFNNISKSEETHMDAVWFLLSTYWVEDPIKDDIVWVFSSEKLQGLYDQLVAKWTKSLIDALEVGITIEDLDIYDLDELSTKTTKEDILIIYDNLNRGSRNHMRAFYKNLSRQWASYEPQFISIEKFTQIINSNQEKA